jgi:hypothetical protein
MQTAAEGRATATLHMVVTRADGTVEDLGVVAAQYKNPLRQLWWEVVGARLSARRIKRANRGLSQSPPS